MKKIFTGTMLIGIIAMTITTGCKKSATDLVNKGFDLDLFNQNLKAAFDDKQVGYSYAISRGGQPLRYHAKGKARLSIDGEKEYTSETRQDIASSAKTVTALAVLKALEENGYSESAKIADFVPAAWNVHADNKNITFEQLLSHKSGLVKFGGELVDLKKTMETPTTGITTNGVYNNVNYALCRVLVCYIVYNHMLLDNSNVPDYTIARYFRDYVREYIFKPAKLTHWEKVDFTDWNENASAGSGSYPFTLYYNFANQSLNGANGGNSFLTSGAGGLFISAYEMAQVLGEAEKGNIVTKEMLQRMKTKMMGFDGVVNGANGGYIWKNGGWDTNDGRGTSTFLVFFPNNVQIMWMTNSRSNSSGNALTAIATAYDASWR